MFHTESLRCGDAGALGRIAGVSIVLAWSEWKVAGNRSRRNAAAPTAATTAPHAVRKYNPALESNESLITGAIRKGREAARGEPLRACNKELPFPEKELLRKLFLRRRSLPHMLLHARFMFGFELLQLRLLIGREHLVQLVVDPRFLHG